MGYGIWDLGLVFTQQHWLPGDCFHAGVISVKYMGRWLWMVSMLSLSEGRLSIQTFRCFNVSLLRAPVCMSQVEQIIPLCGLWRSKYSGGWWGGSFFRNCFEKWNLKAKQHKVHLYKQFSPPGIPLYRDKFSLNKEKNFQTEVSRESASFVWAWIRVGILTCILTTPWLSSDTLKSPGFFTEHLFFPHSLFNIKSNLRTNRSDVMHFCMPEIMAKL